MKKNRCYIDIHVLQTVPPSCVNRDDTGSPKTAVYGGVTRARVSSQAWKRAVRVAFKDIFAQDKLGLRTKKICDRIVNEVLLLKPQIELADAEKEVEKALDLAIKKESKKKDQKQEKKNNKTQDVLFFISNSQVKDIANLICNGDKSKEAYKKAIKGKPSVDQILFGRMVADDASLNYDAAAQVAHSISTHAVQNEFDYFTAVDDCAPEDNAGAGHIGTTEFNSATLYRYATVNVEELSKWLEADTADAVKGFVEAFCYSMPTGKQNSFANRTLPDTVYVTVRVDQPVNLVGAFEKPVRAGINGYLQGSEEALAEYAGKTYERFVPKPELAFCASHNDALSGMADCVALPQIIEKLGEYVKEWQASSGESK